MIVELKCILRELAEILTSIYPGLEPGTSWSVVRCAIQLRQQTLKVLVCHESLNKCAIVALFVKLKKFFSFAGTRTRVSRMRISYPNHLDYKGFCVYFNQINMY